VIDAALLSYAIKHDDIGSLQRAGISDDHFVDEFRTAWRYLKRMKRNHDALPSRDTFHTRFPDITLPRVRRSELGMLIDQIQKRRKFIIFMNTLNDVAGSGIDYENVDEKIQGLVGELNSLAFQGDGASHIADLFSEDITERMVAELRARRRGQVRGIPTGFKRYDRSTGGLQRQKMVVVMGRTGKGKSWIDLVFAANAVIGGHKVMIYPLEMTLTETAFRLYTIFSHEMFGGERTIKNLDLQRGHVPVRKAVRLFNLLQDKFAGQLLVADVGALSDPYTIERIDAEISAYRPDMFWVDYITLLKPPSGPKDEQGYMQVQKLSHGIASIAKRRNVVGGCSAQVNREALKVKEFLPRLEHISFGDSIGQDADDVFSINRGENGDLYYALVKCRGGVEIPKTRVRFKPNEGNAKEHSEQDSDE
jgi:replicative DNA helicase